MKKLRIFTTAVAIFLSLTAASSAKAANFKDYQVVSSNKTWTLKFTQGVTFDQLSKSGIIVKDSKGNVIPVTLKTGSDEKTILVLPPSDGYKTGENYILALNDNIRSSKGKKLKKNTDVHFSIKSDLQKETVLGNTSGNSVNYAVAAETDSYIYFLNNKYWDISDIYRMDKNRKNIIKLNKNVLGEIGSISSVNTTVYYEKYYEKNPAYDYKTNKTVKQYLTNLYTLSSDGTTSTKILTDIDEYIATSNNIYYINTGDNNKLYKSDLDGNNKIKLIDTPINSFNIKDGNIIYSTKEESSTASAGKVYKADLDGSNSTLLTENMGYCLNTADNYVYYINSSDKNKIYKVSLDGKENTKVCDSSARTINVNDGWIYFCNESDPINVSIDSTDYRGTLYKVKTDGTGSQKLNKFHSIDISLAADDVYYHQYFDSGRMSGVIRKKINKDGSNDAMVSDFVDGINNTDNTTNNTDNSTGDNTNGDSGNTPNLDELVQLSDDCISVEISSNNFISKITINTENLPSDIKQKAKGYKLYMLNSFDPKYIIDMLNSCPLNSVDFSNTSEYRVIYSSSKAFLHAAIGLVDANGNVIAYYIE